MADGFMGKNRLLVLQATKIKSGKRKRARVNQALIPC